jgi:hypothetical protein
METVDKSAMQSFFEIDLSLNSQFCGASSRQPVRQEVGLTTEMEARSGEGSG